MNLLITNIQRFSLQDGPGIRTTVFLKGCLAKCPWCANPENLNPFEEYFCNTSKCKKVNNTCHYYEFCNALKEDSILTINDYQRCLVGAIGIYGKSYSTERLYAEIIKDKHYYKADGGITFSGGECLMFIDKLTPIMKKLHDNNINICIESCLFVSPDLLRKSLQYVNTYIVDVKILDTFKCKEILGGNLSFYLENLRLIAQNKKNLIMRFPVVPGYTDDVENITRISRLIKEIQPNKLEIFSVHNLAESKYRSLNRVWTSFETMPFEHLKTIKKMLESDMVPVEIISL